MRKSVVKLLGLVKSVNKMLTGCCRMTIDAIFAVHNKKGLLVKYGKYGALSINDVKQRGSRA